MCDKFKVIDQIFLKKRDKSGQTIKMRDCGTEVIKIAASRLKASKWKFIVTFIRNRIQFSFFFVVNFYVCCSEKLFRLGICVMIITVGFI